MTARYLFAIRQLADASAGGVVDFKTMRAFLQDVVAVRRGDHHAARLQLAAELAEANRQKIRVES